MWLPLPTAPHAKGLNGCPGQTKDECCLVRGRWRVSVSHLGAERAREPRRSSTGAGPAQASWGLLFTKPENDVFAVSLKVIIVVRERLQGTERAFGRSQDPFILNMIV